MALLCFFATPVFAAPPNIQKIIFNGNKFVEDGAIQAEMDSHVGKVFDRKTLSKDIRRLYKTGFFSSIQAEGIVKNQQLILHIKVVENPLVAHFKIKGNDAVTVKDLKKRLKMKEGLIFSDSKLRIDINNIRKLYMKDGFYQLNIDVKKKLLNDGRIDITLLLDEGKKTHVEQIRFVGNNAFTDKHLRGEIHARETDFMSWFSDRDIVDNKRFGNDIQILGQYYQENGYLDAKVNSAQLSLVPGKEAFYLTFNLHEGPVYTVNAVDFSGDIVPTKEALDAALAMHAGEIYSLSTLRNSIQQLTEVVGNEGFAFATVTPLFKRNLAAKEVAITFDIRKGREVYIQRIEISGNQKTNDDVIRREMRLDESARFSAEGMRLSKERLKRSQLFKDVRISMPAAGADDQVDLNIKVEEDRTGSLIVGAGFSQLEKVLLRLKVSEKNFLGKGYNTSLVLDAGAKTQNISASITDPYFMNKEIAASIRINKTQTQLQTITQYKQNNVGGGVNFSFALSEYAYYNIGYDYLRAKLTNIPVTASLVLRSQEGVQTTGELSQGLSWDSRDRVIGTTRGFQHSFNVSVAGIGGANRFVESALSLAAYLPLSDDFTLRGKLGGRVIAGYAKKSVPIYRRYSLGGVGSLRGYDYFGISLRDPASPLDPVGGDRQATASLDLFFPLPYMDTAGIRGVLFADAGTIWGTAKGTVGGLKLNVSEQFSTAKVRASYGFGLEWASPVGPITLTWGKAQRQQPGDLTRTFEFGLGQSF
ncbi:MAG: outer membrane protein assembly factor BamA [Mariprofundaceae bacterium]|nr:outer membrane protein assembly factor BamA [Mariprofundaceae bacterium]